MTSYRISMHAMTFLGLIGFFASFIGILVLNYPLNAVAAGVAMGAAMMLMVWGSTIKSFKEDGKK